MGLIDLLPSTLLDHPFVTVSALLIIPVLSILIHDILLWLHLPPGPLPLPFLGNKLSIPKESPWLYFTALSHTYGPIYTLWIGRQPTLIISDPAVVVDLLEKRSAKYSSRPRMIALAELYSRNNSILVQPYGKEWSIRRKLMHAALTPKALNLYKPTQEAEATRLCNQLLETPDNYEKLIERFTSSVVFCIGYGRRIDSLQARVIRQRFVSMHFQAQLLTIGRYMVETLPFLKHTPTIIAPWKREIQAKGLEEGQMNHALFANVRKEMQIAKEKGGEAPSSLSKILLELKDREPVPLSEAELSYIPASLFGAGSDTTASTMCSAILALVTNPHVLVRVHEELDSVIGDQRTPTFEDESKLPYLRGFIKEVLRWRPVAVLGGTPRATTEKDVYRQWTIPSGTSVLTNAWGVNHNEAYYPDHDRFEPLRFYEPVSSSPSPTTNEISEKVPLSTGEEKTRTYVKSGLPFPTKSGAGQNVFGLGRRTCPGADLALNSLYASLSKLLWAYDVLPLTPDTSYDTYDYTQGINVRPKPFRVRIVPRDEGRIWVLREEMRGASAWLERFRAFGEEDLVA